MQGSATTNGHQDFDYFFGAWTVSHRKLARRLAGCDDWVRFEGESQTSPILGGVGNLEDNLLKEPDGAYRAAALRAFNLNDQTWNIWWLNQDRMAVEPPVTGRFEGDEGLFIGPDEVDGRPILVRFIWTKLPPDQARWEQAFSTDQGVSWETNWVMEFQRR